LDIPIKNVASVASTGCPDAIHRLFTDLMGEDVMCCRWPPPPLPQKSSVAKKPPPPSISLAARSQPSRPVRQPPAKKSTKQTGRNRMGRVVFSVTRQRDARRQKLEAPAFQGHSRFQRLCSVHLRHGKQHKTSKRRIVLNLRNTL
jgi:hypothetical protein